MADQPSITSILAALAAQRPNATPPQNQQPAYQPPQQQPNPYAQTGGYSLPQPTNSGSVDLSGIKPVSSGTVSIQDAIAKAKVIAAEKGVAYDRAQSYVGQPPMPSGRPYSPRSRSRSPQPTRRDAFRDNFNPYRDERRGPPGRDYRERSFSPGVRGRGPPEAFPPPHGGAGAYARERSPIRGAEDNVESISIESNLVGLIIGRQGENLRRVESETGCRVQFITGPDETGPFRTCKITGPRARRADAKAEITRIIDDSGLGPLSDRAPREQNATRDSSHQPALRDGEDSMQIMVPDRTVGLIIGRGGETIRDLQERSGCHVNIVGEQKSVNGLRPVNLIGTREAAAMAKDLIMEIVESDSKSAPKERAPAPRENNRDAGYGGGYASGGASGGGQGDKINDSIFVPSEAVGMIIGKGGETIKDMQNTTGCKINVTQSSGPGEVEREIGLVGSQQAIAAAKRAIEDKVDAVKQQKNNGGGGGGHRNNRGQQNQQNEYGDRGYSQQSYAQPQGQQGQQAPPSGADDPYAAYGGYANYAQLWYQALAAQGQGDTTKPPGTS
ncbi:putative kh domain-containing protein [Botrytis fragariae]|uniref:Putative kh domain-containing protein n=1 Tax=Botrytis fragariae TaxID=1964551 RepID=A0A8H6EHW9_9HELO|nr:putative kh domain-containing protein [Botrytis fragariae]KAF5872853.1 putative kh domain-containing protein [Botrytis fragariae]